MTHMGGVKFLLIVEKFSALVPLESSLSPWRVAISSVANFVVAALDEAMSGFKKLSRREKHLRGGCS